MWYNYIVRQVYRKGSLDLTQDSRKDKNMRKELEIHKAEIEREFGITETHPLYKIEMRAEEHLLRMTEHGVRIDLDKMKMKVGELELMLSRLGKEIWKESNGSIKESNSSAQVALYYQSIGYQFPRTVKGNPQVNQETLAEIGTDLSDKICEYRKKLSSLSQLKSVFSDIGMDGRVHPKYLSTKCATGRIYTAAPNIQGWGDDAKELIVPDDGFKLMTADYKAQELRIVAAVSGCKNLLRAFANGEDVHTSTYSMMFKVPAESVTKEQRSIGKVLNFATIYGQTPEGLARKMHVSVEEARRLQNLYFATYPEIRSWLNRTIAESHRTGYSSTPWGRSRRIHFGYDAAKGERQATNTPIQGAGADVIKRALACTMVNPEQVRVLITIHDSLVIQYREDLNEQEVADWLKSRMEINFLNKVNLAVDIK